MKEVFLHHIWRMKYFDLDNLQTFHGSLIEIINFGKLNQDSGPDFYHTEIIIGKQLWAGCVEMHVNSSDWDLHKHSLDSAYNNVILHVVWNHDKEIDYLRERNIETLILKDFVSKEVVFNYENIINNFKKEIACKNLIQGIDWDKINLWFNGLLIDRLQEKSKKVLALYDKTNHNWEELTFKMFASNFGLKVNQDAFEIWSSSFPFKILQKIQNNSISVEALFFGQAGFLNYTTDEYSKLLLDEFNYLKNKFQLTALDQHIFKFSSMRPHGFPTIRLAQLSAVYSTEKQLFSKIIQFKNIKEIECFFEQFKLNPYWNKHYIFGKESKESIKSISKEKIHNLIINTIIPLRFTYEMYLDKLDVDFYIQLLEAIKTENNSITTLFKDANFLIQNAKDSQLLLHLKKYYCDEKKCLNCAIGNEVLKP